MTKSADPDETAHNEPSHLGLYCLHRYLFRSSGPKWLICSAMDMSCSTVAFKQNSWAHLFKTNDVVSQHIVKTLIILYGIYANIFAAKMRVVFAFIKAAHIFISKIHV